MAINKYLNLITSEHKTKPNFMSWVSANLNLINDATLVMNNIITNFDIDKAIGVQLDTLGVILGLSRTVNFQPGDGSSPDLDDSTYRLILKSRVIRNQWDGTIISLQKLWNTAFPDVAMQIVDNQNMTITSFISGQLDLIYMELVANGYIIPRPMGVELKVYGLSIAKETPSIGILVTTLDSVGVSMKPLTWDQRESLNYTWNQLDALNLNWIQTEFYESI